MYKVNYYQSEVEANLVNLLKNAKNYKINMHQSFNL